MEVEEAIRGRCTHKAYGPEPVDRATLDELLELARWAPNHNLTNPWRFRASRRAPCTASRRPRVRRPGPSSTARRRCAISALQTGDPVQDVEDVRATACRRLHVLLAAHARGLAGYWRSRPECCARRRARRRWGSPRREAARPTAPGPPRQEQRDPERAPTGDFVTRLD